MSASEVFKHTSNSVFKLEIYDTANNLMKTGSGFVIDSSGIAVTNYHIIDEGNKIVARFENYGSVYREIAVEKVLLTDKDRDLATIKLVGNDFNYIRIGKKRFPDSGQKAYAIGSPLGLAISITEGIISNGSQYINNQRYVQMTTPISHGNSDGLLADSFGI